MSYQQFEDKVLSLTIIEWFTARELAKMIDYDYRNTLAGLQIIAEEGSVSCKGSYLKYFKIKRI